MKGGLTFRMKLKNKMPPMLSDTATKKKFGWGARIRTWECRYQKPVPYRLATPQQALRNLRGSGAYNARMPGGKA